MSATRRILIFHAIAIKVFFSSFSQSCIPRNIIIMIGDGMGFEQYKATQYFFDKDSISLFNLFEIKAAAHTGNHGVDYDPARAWVDKNYLMSAFTESSAAATAISTGYLTLQGMLGLTPDSIPVLHLAELAYRLNKSSGVVTSVPFTHATPAGFAIHHPNRKSYTNIAYEMLLHSPLQLIMGTGHPFYDNDGKLKNTPSWTYIDSSLWNFFFALKNKNIIYNGASYYFSKEWLGTDNILVLDSAIRYKAKLKKLVYIPPIFESLSYNRTGISKQPYDIPFPEGIPTLDRLSTLALRFLSQDPDGFFLMIEGGAIDWAGHDNNLSRLIEETREFFKAVRTVIHWIDSTNSWSNTLLIVMADHETGLLCNEFEINEGFKPVQHSGYHIMPKAKFLSSDHTNQLVPFFAKGCGSQLFASYLKKNDPRRGVYLHISHVSHAVKQLWGNSVFVYPTEVTACKNEPITFYASIPCPNAKITWYVNTKPTSCQNYSCSFKFKKNAQIICSVECNDQKITSNIVHVKIR
ncbi:MAG: alkaline phosphatase [Bacteroidales bacterium]|nr:alkaline phosphatase [Bacteroidales bacterium]